MFRNNQGARFRAARQCVQANSFLAEPLGDLQNGQFGEGAAHVHAPAVQGFGSFLRKRKDADGQTAQILRFFSGRNHGDAGKAARASKAVSIFEAMATFGSKPQPEERCTRCAAISSSERNK